MTKNATTETFYLGVAENRKFVAASVDTAVFCFVGDNERELIEKACRAYEFATSTEPRRAVAVRTHTTNVIDFIPGKRVPICEPALAAAG